ncbi:hypothetical protein COCOBI_08-0490 [Coccomyxa sp. Obi]|nr:hypothetical protein COCOBI_08-0490 [Coccomyxa sp. Obi]
MVLEVTFVLAVERRFDVTDWGAFIVCVANSARVDYSDVMVVDVVQDYLPIGVTVVTVHFINKTLDEAQFLAQYLEAVIKSGDMKVHFYFLKVPLIRISIERTAVISYQSPLGPCDLGRLMDWCNGTAALAFHLASNATGVARGCYIRKDGRGLTPTNRKALAVMLDIKVERELEPRDWGAFLVGIGNSARVDYSDIIIFNTTNLLPGVATARVFFINTTLDEAQSLAKHLEALAKSGNMMVHLMYLRVPVKEVSARHFIIPYQLPERWLQPCQMGRLMGHCNEYPCKCRTTARMVGATINGTLSGGPIALIVLAGSGFLLDLLDANGPLARHLPRMA